MLECMFLLPLYGNNVCIFSSKHFSFYVCMFMGLVARIDNGMVASSLLVGGLGMLQVIGSSIKATKEGGVATKGR